MDTFTPEQEDQGGVNALVALATNTSIASVAIGDSNHIRVYFQDAEGYLKESEYGDGAWAGSARIKTKFHAKPNTPLAATIYGGGEQLHIRLYYVDMNSILREHDWDYLGNGQWSQDTGVLSEENIKVDYRSKVAACSWSPQGDIRVYYQAPYEQGIREVGWIWTGETTGGWQRRPYTLSLNFVLPLLGSGLAAILRPQERQIKIFYQSALDRMVRECWILSNSTYSWGASGPGATLGEAVSGTAIAAITWSPDPQLRVYYEHPKDLTVENGFGMNNVAEWSGPRHLAKSLIGTSLSACCFSSGSTTHIRVYFEKEEGRVVEYCGIGNWTQSAVVPI